MNGLMMDVPLTIPSILKRAAQVYPEKEIVSRWSDGSITRTNYGTLYKRVVRLMNVLRDLGVQPGDRVATSAWNSSHHLELYFAIPSLGAVLHTVNIRLFPDQIRFIVNHAEDRFVFLDRSLAGLYAELQPSLTTVERYILMDDRGTPPTTMPSPASDYETLLASASDEEYFPPLEENMAAGLCYTSGTTGEPKGTLYSHRATYLHAMGACMVDSLGISEKETVMSVVPMFHANAWGLPYACAMTGAKQVFPGPHLLGGAIASLMEAEQVTLSAGVPTVWNILYQHLKQHSQKLTSLRVIISGGSAIPRKLIADYEHDLGVEVVCVWGMTELSPIGTVARLRGAMRNLPAEKQLAIRATQGISVPCVEIAILNEEGESLPWDGESTGELASKGPWVASGYYNTGKPNTALTKDGWFLTGDVAAITPYGYVEITDRKKDMIKSRGEWISSIDMENLAVEHPNVREAAVVGRHDPVRDEVPVVAVVLNEPRPQEEIAREMRDLLATQFANWQLPKLSDIRIVEALPKTSVGKLDKKVLRVQILNSET